ncbi:MAG: ABC transporter substrate-binding protein, partial [Candidatus Omnitrophica bacterium]|nr:ABC transporter substrate-binding protein [Candidatus Omnitrophota bacterium]
TIISIAFFIWSVPAACGGQKILIATYEDNPEYRPAIRAFLTGMQEAAPNVEILTLTGGNDPNDFMLKVRNLERDVVLVFTVGTSDTLLVKAAGVKIPVVFSAIIKPQKIGLVNKLREPGTNFTGSFCAISIIRQLHFIIDALPAVKRIGIIYNPRDADTLARVDDWAAGVAMTEGLTLVRYPLPDTVDSAEALAAVTRQMIGKVDLIVTIMDASIIRYGEGMLRVANEYKIPTYTTISRLIDEGALLGVGFDFPAAVQTVNIPQVLNILKGRKPADIPVGTITQYNVMVNQKTARHLGVVIPKSILKSATKIIE